jgi:hypothetical protein
LSYDALASRVPSRLKVISGLKGRFCQPRATPWEQRTEQKFALQGRFTSAHDGLEAAATSVIFAVGHQLHPARP